MFIEEILKIDNLVFKPQDELKKAKYNRIELFEDGWQNIILPNPPKNSSTETRNEIEEIKKRYDQKTDEDIQQYINSDEDSSYYIKLVLEESIFQNLCSSLAITSFNLLLLIFLFPMKKIDLIFVFSPRFIFIRTSTLFLEIFLVLISTSVELYPIEE